MTLNNINAAYGLCESLYGITPNQGEFEDLALEAWNRIGVKHTRLYRYVGSVRDGVLELPCNYEGGYIESVHIPFVDAQITSSSTNYPWENIWIESYIDKRTYHDDPYFQRGKLVKYDEGDNELYFAHDYPKVMVVYHGILADEESGLPLVNDKELRAIASFIASILARWYRRSCPSKIKTPMKGNDAAITMNANSKTVVFSSAVAFLNVKA